MQNEQDLWMCTECGYTSTDRFIGDICPRCGLTYWQCPVCGFTMVGATASVVCPECQTESEFINISCYIPGWREADIVNSSFFER
jgi:rubrerythrin